MNKMINTDKKQQKIRLLSGLSGGSHTSVLTSNLRDLFITYRDKFVKICVEVRGIEPPQTGFAGWMPHQCTPTQVHFIIGGNDQ